MPSWTLSTNEYDIQLKSLLSRRLSQVGVPFVLDEKEDKSIAVTIRGLKAQESLSEALSKLLCRDMQYFVLAKMADAMPLSIGEKEEVLTDALQTARAREEIVAVQADLKEYLTDTRQICLEGYIRFRMQDCLLVWQMCVEQAATEVLLRKEYSELMEVLSAFVGTRPPRILEIQLCIHADGSCTLTDDSLVRIEYVDCCPDGIVSLLVNMAPQRLVVYDLSGKRENRLTETLAHVFSGRVKIYR
ncbi:MAG: putative sporulation protein YtxC [Clostridiales bacterium]|nr:putative sporulation protein YtxC [Clostridiales bacterium]